VAALYEDKIAEGVTLPQPRISTGREGIDNRYLSLVNIVPLIDGEDTLHTFKGSIPFWGTGGLGRLSDEKQDYEIYFRLRESVHALEKQSGITVTKLKVTGYGAPQGNYRKNEKNASTRALALKNYLRSNYVVNKVPLEVSWVAEDWDSIRTLVETSDMPLRQAVTDIINTVDLTKGRERMLIGLADGTSYGYLVERIFPRVCRVEYAINYTQHRLDTAEGRRLFEMGSRSLKLSEFFSVAMSYPKGSNEYNDAFDLAARLFPDSPEAAINAAAVALSKRDVKKARAYLEKYATLPLAYNNMGILYLLEGNRDKAEVYFQMAAAAGVGEAREALSFLRTQH
jgi:tetratricopeptide (TPR) repeat protein